MRIYNYYEPDKLESGQVTVEKDEITVSFPHEKGIEHQEPVTLNVTSQQVYDQISGKKNKKYPFDGFTITISSDLVGKLWGIFPKYRKMAMIHVADIGFMPVDTNDFVDALKANR